MVDGHLRGAELSDPDDRVSASAAALWDRADVAPVSAGLPAPLHSGAVLGRHAVHDAAARGQEWPVCVDAYCPDTALGGGFWEFRDSCTAGS